MPCDGCLLEMRNAVVVMFCGKERYVEEMPFPFETLVCNVSNRTVWRLFKRVSWIVPCWNQSPWDVESEVDFCIRHFSLKAEICDQEWYWMEINSPVLSRNSSLFLRIWILSLSFLVRTAFCKSYATSTDVGILLCHGSASWSTGSKNR